jgi:hypothetical protein
VPDLWDCIYGIGTLKTPSLHPSISDDHRRTIDLTGPSSHVLDRERSFAGPFIGPSAPGGGYYLHVKPDEHINWAALDIFATPGARRWPRYLSYVGQDAGFFEWARERPIESFNWSPVLPVDRVIDVGGAKIQRLTIAIDRPGGRLLFEVQERRTSERQHYLKVTGDLSRFSTDGYVPFHLELAPSTGRHRDGSPYLLPDMGELQRVTHLGLHGEPLAQPLSLECLGRFPNLVSLDLFGNFTDLEELARQPQLRGLRLRCMPNLNGLPALSTWPDLNRLHASNIDESEGKRLRREYRARAKTCPWTGPSGVGPLRKPAWWESEFGRPFSEWPARLARLANRAYDVALAELRNAPTMAVGEAAIKAFTGRFNTLTGIGSPERDDLGDAVYLLGQSENAVRLGITEDMAQAWFDTVRDY